MWDIKTSTLAKGVKVTPFGVMSVLFERSSSYGAFTLDPLDVGVGWEEGVAFLVLVQGGVLRVRRICKSLFCVHCL